MPKRRKPKRRVDEILIYGAGGFARETAWHLARAAESGDPVKLVAFVDDAPSAGAVSLDHAILTFAEARTQFPRAKVIVAIGDPKARRTVAARCRDAGWGFATVVHPEIDIPNGTRIGAGCVLMVGATLTTNVKIGDHVQVNPGVTLAHDVEVGDYVTITPGVRVSGFVTVEEGAYLGTGCVILQGSHAAPLRIGAGAIVGAGAVVRSSVAPRTTVVGVPARPLTK